MRRAGPFRIRTLCVAVFCIAAMSLYAGCAKTRPPIAVPLVPTPPSLHATHRPGDPVVPAPAPAAPYADPVAVRVTYYATEQMPDASGGESVASRTRLVIRERADDPVRPAADLTRGAVLYEDAGPLADDLAAGPPTRAQPLGQLVGLLPKGVTFATRLDDPYTGLDPTSSTPARRYVAVDVARPAPGAPPAAAPSPAATRAAVPPTPDRRWKSH